MSVPPNMPQKRLLHEQGLHTDRVRPDQARNERYNSREQPIVTMLQCQSPLNRYPSEVLQVTLAFSSACADILPLAWSTTPSSIQSFCDPLAQHTTYSHHLTPYLLESSLPSTLLNHHQRTRSHSSISPHLIGPSQERNGLMIPSWPRSASWRPWGCIPFHRGSAPQC